MRRVVSTSPSMTEAVFALGRGELLVGRTSFCDFPAEASRVEVIGGFADPSLERVLSLTPDLVCGERGPAGPDFVAALERQGIATYFPPIDRVGDVLTALEELSRRLDALARGRELTRAIRSRLDEVAAATQGAALVRVVMLFDFKPLVAAGVDTFPDDVIARAGGRNVAAGVGKYPKLGVEGLLELDPDVLLDGSAGAYSEPPEALVASIPGLSALRAAKAGRVVRLPGTSALRPGPRIAEGVLEVARLLHPTRFAP
ncbi:MAG: ABC transporter substrate-binding protein [Polyangiaceae bacterium]|nr:ABC transporter substrate-binding protein [Polyangiaceae bacterium]